MSLSTWSTLLATFTLAVVSPGPDFLVVLRSSLRSGASYGIATALGIAFGTSLWAAGTLAGVITIFQTNAVLNWLLHLVGALFLICYGIAMLRQIYLSRINNKRAKSVPLEFTTSKAICLRNGFLTTTVGNPKAVIFYSAIFVSLAPATITLVESATLIALMATISFTWFCVVSVAASRKTFARIYQHYGWLIDIILSFVFITVGTLLVFNN